MDPMELEAEPQHGAEVQTQLMIDATDASVESTRWNVQSIYPVPERVKNITNRRAYQPELVSLGPFHYGAADLMPMEEHKQRALRHLVMRSGKPVKAFADAVAKVAQKLEDAYEALDENWRGSDANRARFVDLMVADGCFFLEVMRLDKEKGKLDDYAPNDPVFSEHGYMYLSYAIRSDMLVIENQLPLLLLKTLAALQTDGTSDQGTQDININKMVLNFLGREDDMDGIDQLGLHLLHMLHKSLCGVRHDRTGSEIGLGDDEGRDAVAAPSAVELHGAGINFTVSKSNRESNRNELQHAKSQFNQGLLSMAKITVQDNTERMFLNLMAFERLHAGAGNDVTAYVAFMDNLINTPSDVALLRSKMIINNMLGSDQEVANLFNTLANGSVLGRFSAHLDVREKVNKYRMERWNKWRANFMQTYMRNPWVFISLVAAVILLVASLLQTVYTVLSYKKKP